MKTGIELIILEREEQITKHGYDSRHDKSNSGSELLYAAIYCITGEEEDYPLGWNGCWKEKIDTKSEINKLAIAGALIAAEIDRLTELNKEEVRNE